MNSGLQISRGELQHGFYLVSFQARKKLEKIIYSHTAFQIFEESAYCNTGISENPDTAYFLWTAFDRRAIAPVQIVPVEHQKTICQRVFGSKVTAWSGMI
jgi:hypothetical protein